MADTYYFLDTYIRSKKRDHQCLCMLIADLSITALIDDTVNSSNRIAWNNMMSG